MSLSKASQHLKERLKNPNVHGVAIKYIPTIKRLQIVKRSVFSLRYPNNLFLLLGNADIYWEEYMDVRKYEMFFECNEFIISKHPCIGMFII